MNFVNIKLESNIPWFQVQLVKIMNRSAKIKIDFDLEWPWFDRDKNHFWIIIWITVESPSRVFLLVTPSSSIRSCSRDETEWGRGRRLERAGFKENKMKIIIIADIRECRKRMK